jgi:thiol-disulfide isomerase/thioredoxin
MLKAITSAALLVLSFGPTPVAGAEGTHGNIEWFQGGFERLLETAKASNRLVLLDFWTEWCTWCKRLDRETFSDPSVVAEMKDVLAWNVDAESPAGAPLAKRLFVGTYPALIVLGPDGVVRDRIGGFLAPEDFKRELRRVRADRGTRSDLERRVAARTTDVDLRWALAEKLGALGDHAGRRTQIDAIRELDPEGRSLAMHHVAFEDSIAAIDATWKTTGKLDVKPLATFLERETHREVLFEGWKRMNQMQAYLVQEAARTGRQDEAAKQRQEMRKSARRALENCPAGERAAFGNQLAWDYWETRTELTAEEKIFALEVARSSAASSKDDVHVIDTLACCLFMNGKTEEAMREIQRCIDLEPGNSQWRRRLAEFQAR